MAKRGPKAKNGEHDEGNGGAPAKGHNSTLTDDERRALTLHHKRAYEAADALVEKAKSERTAVADLAKSDLGKGTMAEIKDMIAFGDEKKVKAGLERTLRLARWLGMPFGTQLHMFEAPASDPREDGKVAGMAGEECRPPRHLAAVASQHWTEGWHEGQTILASAFAKKRQDAPADIPHVDTSDRPFAPAEEAVPA